MTPSEPHFNQQKTIASFLVILAVVIVTVSVKSYDNRTKPLAGLSNSINSNTSTTQLNNPNLPSQSTINNSSTNSPSTPTTSSYKDGTFTASSDYYVPHGIENIKVTLVLKNGLVTDSSVQNSETNPESAHFQENFAAEYKSYVVGQNVNNLQLSYISGASDTVQGFDDALQKIQSQAKV